MIDHDVTGAGIEGHHPAAVRMRQLAVGYTADIEGQNGADVAKGHVVQILHQRCAGSAQRMIHRSEMGHDMRVTLRRHDGGLADLKAAAIWPVEPARDQVLAVIIVAQQVMNRRLLINGLAVEADHLDVTRPQVVLAHEGAGRLGVNGAGEIVEPGQFKQADLVLERFENHVGHGVRPLIGITANEFGSCGIAIGARLDLDQHHIDPVK
jgi:hypothetical protein